MSTKNPTPRDPMMTPVQPFEAGIGNLGPDEWKGLALRLDRMVGRMPGFLGPDDLGAPGIAQDLHTIKKVLGRMPQTNGLEDEGEGIARYVSDHRTATRQNSTRTKAALVFAALAFLGAATQLVRAETAKVERETPMIPAPAPAR